MASRLKLIRTRGYWLKGVGNQLFWLLNFSETTLSLLSTKGDLTWKKLHFHIFQMSQHKCTKDDGSQAAQWAGHRVQRATSRTTYLMPTFKETTTPSRWTSFQQMPKWRTVERSCSFAFPDYRMWGLESPGERLGWTNGYTEVCTRLFFLWLYPFFPLRRGPIAPKKHCMAVFYNHCSRRLSAMMDMFVVQTCDQQQHVTIKGYSGLFHFN